MKQPSLFENLPFTEKDEGILLFVKIKPNSSKNKIIGIEKYESYKTRLVISLMDIPIDGKANKALISFLSKHFKVSKKNILIKKGEFSKEKTILFIKINIETFKKAIYNHSNYS